MTDKARTRGHYLGTELNEKWWRRCRHHGLLARGIGEYWFEDNALFFRRFLMAEPIVIHFRDVTGVRVGKWHAGRWAGGAQVVKVVWNKAGDRLSSGFVMSRQKSETSALVARLRDAIAGQTQRISDESAAVGEDQ